MVGQTPGMANFRAIHPPGQAGGSRRERVPLRLVLRYGSS